MANTIELHGYLWLRETFAERKWSNPYFFSVENEITALELLAKLDIAKEKVGVIFVNGKAHPPSRTTINPGDRVALVSPGAPMFMELGSRERACSFAS
jgi:sulfur carrier protein ThiS